MDLITPDNLITDATDGPGAADQPIEFKIDPTVQTLIEQELSRHHAHERNTAITVDTDDALTVVGRETLEVSEKLYSDAADCPECGPD